MNKLEISQMVDRNVELAEEILRLKSQRGAITLVHNYQRGEVQER
jgi:quinolinate synthase